MARVNMEREVPYGNLEDAFTTVAEEMGLKAKVRFHKGSIDITVRGLIFAKFSIILSNREPTDTYLISNSLFAKDSKVGKYVHSVSEHLGVPIASVSDDLSIHYSGVN